MNSLHRQGHFKTQLAPQKQRGERRGLSSAWATGTCVTSIPGHTPWSALKRARCSARRHVNSPLTPGQGQPQDPMGLLRLQPGRGPVPLPALSLRFPGPLAPAGAARARLVTHRGAGAGREGAVPRVAWTRARSRVACAALSPSASQVSGLSDEEAAVPRPGSGVSGAGAGGAPPPGSTGPQPPAEQLPAVLRGDPESPARRWPLPDCFSLCRRRQAPSEASCPAPPQAAASSSCRLWTPDVGPGQTARTAAPPSRVRLPGRPPSSQVRAQIVGDVSLKGAPSGCPAAAPASLRPQMAGLSLFSATLGERLTPKPGFAKEGTAPEGATAPPR